MRANSAVSREFGISRQTGYTWWKRYAEGGSSQVAERSRRPVRSPARTAAELAQRVIELRQRWPDWGAPKLSAVLARECGGTSPLVVRMVHRIL
jgi:transposase